MSVLSCTRATRCPTVDMEKSQTAYTVFLMHRVWATMFWQAFLQLCINLWLQHAPQNDTSQWASLIMKVYHSDAEWQKICRSFPQARDIFSALTRSDRPICLMMKECKKTLYASKMSIIIGMKSAAGRHSQVEKSMITLKPVNEPTTSLEDVMPTHEADKNISPTIQTLYETGSEPFSYDYYQTAWFISQTKEFHYTRGLFQVCQRC